MALKTDRVEDPYAQDITFSMTAVAERGGVVCIVTAGSGGAMDTGGTVAYATGIGKPIGLLLNDMISIDLTRFPRHYNKDEMPIPGKCTLLRKGFVVTNMIPNGVNPNGGDSAYLANGGLVSNVQAAGAPQVGQWLSAKDQDGFAKLQVNM